MIITAYQGSQANHCLDSFLAHTYQVANAHQFYHSPAPSTCCYVSLLLAELLQPLFGFSPPR